MLCHRPGVASPRRSRLATIVVVGAALLLLVLAMATTTNAAFFAPNIIPSRGTRSSVKMAAAMDVPLPPSVVVTMPTAATTMSSSQQQPQGAGTTTSNTPLQDGVQSYSIRMSSSNRDATVLSSNSVLLALQERKIPTAEEIAQKKLNFNLLFWGGGFVAPFLATVFYFGTRFWEK